MKTHRLRRGGIMAALAAATVLVSAAPAYAEPGDGSAYGAKVDVQLLGQDAVQAGPFAAASTEGPTQNSFAGVNLPGVLKTGVINTEAVRDDESGAVTAKASTTDVEITLLKAALKEAGVKLVEAVCTATQEGVKGSTQLVGANLGKLGDVSSTPAANTELAVKLPGVGNIATVILNEQIKNKDGSLTVNAVHVKLLGDGLVGAIGSGDVVVSSATCGPAAPPIPMASGAGLWIGLGLVAAVGLPAGVYVIRRRRGATTEAAA
ncbi:hypothetical protein SAMN05421810_105363 [Amycolatopsis arida]|uniref:LPXTG-motif cell wall anchor domain-containing protein n=1 Tax=Amycolatopsis arida TaxID=587909 RepID=A0A1I5WZY5_9PSEU|nr:choice-of-anchor P family protein [Amycolatopsis arida]TDX92537.1 hypothetical protein CLV69_105382 [Amycolatopsis arida]SFQ25342.1 hypothetical protein SAMN05421810_105363 [Amycolatopsis arida]